MKTAYHFGYQGSKPEDLIAAVTALNAIVCDIRLAPYSRWQPGWNKKSLQALFGSSYIHVPQLGNLNYKSGGPIAIADLDEGLKIVCGLLETRPAVLICACKNSLTCHRSQVAYKLLDMGVEVEELVLMAKDKMTPEQKDASQRQEQAQQKLF